MFTFLSLYSVFEGQDGEGCEREREGSGGSVSAQ